MRTVREGKKTERHKTNRPREYDTPIDRPEDELPAWFVRTLNSRFTTKRTREEDRETRPVRSRRGSSGSDQ